MADKLTAFAWRHSRRDQIIITALTATTFPLMWATLELPKRIINDAIDGRNFPRQIGWMELEQTQYLLALCLAYLGAVAGNNALKYILNVRRGLTGERMLRRMRFDLFRRVMGRPLTRLRATNPGELVQMISAELAPVGDFIGAIFATPLMAGGQFIVYLGFIIVQNAMIGAAALALYPVQAWLVPKLQARVVALIRERIANIRAMARDVTESIEGAPEILALRTRRWHMAVVSRRLYDNFVIRKRIFYLKYLIKFVNNVADHVTPFFIFLIGGWFVIDGTLDLGALTAVLIAYKNLSAPWKELLNYYQTFSDMAARYQYVMDQFQHDEEAPALPERAPQGPHALALTDARAPGLPAPVTCHVPAGARVAVVDRDAARRGALLAALAGIAELQSGGWSSSQPIIYRASALVRSDARVFAGSFRFNMLLGLMFRPVADADDPEAETRRREALATGAPPDDVDARWIDPAEAGYRDMAHVESRILEAVHGLELDDDLYVIGLGSRADPDARPRLARTLLDLRRHIAASAELGPMREDFIDVWRPDRFNANASLGENVFYARPLDPETGWAGLLADRKVMRALDAAGIRPLLTDIAIDLCETLLSLFEGVAADSDLLREYGLFSRSETPEIRAIVHKARRRGPTRLSRAETRRLLTIAMDYRPARFRLAVLRAKGREPALVAARPALRKALGDDPRLEFIDETRYMRSFSISENLFFGPVRVERRDSWGPFKRRVDVLVRETGLREDVLRLGLDQPVGEGGMTLNARQRVRLALGRALMKNPAALLLDGVAAGDEQADLDARARLHRALDGGALVWGAATARAARDADAILRFDDAAGGVLLQEGPESLARLDGAEDEGR